MLKKILIIAIALVSFAACKKDKTTPSNTTSNNTGTPPADGTQSNATTFNGIFTTGSYSTDIPNNPISSSKSARAYFSNTPMQYMNQTTAVSVNKVYLNNDSLWYNSTGKYYNSMWPVNLATETWSVNGANGIASFSISVNSIDPSFVLGNPFPDSISVSAGFTVNVNNVTNAKYAYVSILDGTNNTNGFVNKTINTGNNTIVFSASELNALTLTNTGYLFVVLSNDQAFYFSSKSYQFVREIQYNKHIKIKS